MLRIWLLLLANLLILQKFSKFEILDKIKSKQEKKMNEERFLKAYQEVQKLIDTFEENENIYKDTTKYTEAQVRTDFIDKFYIALGWDVNHQEQTNPFEQEVKVEVSQRQEGETGSKRADYAFYLAPNYKKPQFFVEAKQPSKALMTNKDFYFQTAKYGWNAGTGVSILTDFEEIVIINCIIKPDYEKILECHIDSFTYKDFRDKDKFRKFYNQFSHEAVQEGKLREYVKNIATKTAGGERINETVSIDHTFLKYIEAKRLEMAQAIHAKNPDLDSYQLTEATQKVIDRLVFMRFLEDKNIEPENILHNISTAEDPWGRMKKRSAELDSKYNGIVFKPSILEGANFRGVDIEKFRAIAKDLDHKHTPFDFNYIPIHILGTIYERFLGNIIVIEKGDIDIQMKPEVRKAGGVFYTPQYIVDYIVQNTIGKLIEGKKPQEIAKLKFADIACGSGSFLIGAYEYLLEYHTKYYNDKATPKVAEKDGCILDPKTNKYVLSIKQKQVILLNNIYGVDIDHQATEVTQMSLFLKLLEDETMATANQMQTLFKEKILPDMSENIKCGNSLIGLDVVPNVLQLSVDESRRLTPFDFRDEFENIFNNGGFDAIIGNPPYVSLQRNYFDTRSWEYLSKNYTTIYAIADLFAIFVEKAISLMKKNAYFGYIIPSTFLINLSFKYLRRLILNNYHLYEIVQLGDGVFKGATVPTCLLFIQNNNENDLLKLISKVNDFETQDYYCNEVSQFVFNDNDLCLINAEYDDSLQNVISSIEKEKEKLESIFVVREGIKTGNDKKFLSKEIIDDNYLPIIKGRHVQQYYSSDSGLFIKYPNQELSRPQNIELFNGEKLLIRRVTNKIIANYDDKNLLCVHTLYVGKMREHSNYSIKFILGILNSKLIDFYQKTVQMKKGEVFPEIRIYQLNSLPIPVINEKNKHLHDEIVELVNQMLDAKKSESTAVSSTSKTMAQRVINSLEKQINAKVYEIYGLSDEEIAIID